MDCTSCNLRRAGSRARPERDARNYVEHVGGTASNLVARISPNAAEVPRAFGGRGLGLRSGLIRSPMMTKVHEADDDFPGGDLLIVSVITRSSSFKRSFGMQGVSRPGYQGAAALNYADRIHDRRPPILPGG